MLPFSYNVWTAEFTSGDLFLLPVFIFDWKGYVLNMAFVVTWELRQFDKAISEDSPSSLTFVNYCWDLRCGRIIADVACCRRRDFDKRYPNLKEISQHNEICIQVVLAVPYPCCADNIAQCDDQFLQQRSDPRKQRASNTPKEGPDCDEWSDDMRGGVRRQAARGPDYAKISVGLHQQAAAIHHTSRTSADTSLQWEIVRMETHI